MKADSTARLYRQTGHPEQTRRIYHHVLTLQPEMKSRCRRFLVDAGEDGDLDALAQLTSRLKASRKNVREACSSGVPGTRIGSPGGLEQLSSLAGARTM